MLQWRKSGGIAGIIIKHGTCGRRLRLLSHSQLFLHYFFHKFNIYLLILGRFCRTVILYYLGRQESSLYLSETCPGNKTTQADVRPISTRRLRCRVDIVLTSGRAVLPPGFLVRHQITRLFSFQDCMLNFLYFIHNIVDHRR